MSEYTTRTWIDQNQRYLVVALERVRALLKEHIAQRQGEAPATPAPAMPEFDHRDPPALELLCQIFHLSPFERDLLILCAGIELDGEFPQLCAQAQRNPDCTFPTFALALAALPGAYWEAIIPTRALRRWRLIELGHGVSLTNSPLRMSEQVLHYLTGIRELDERLLRVVDAVSTDVTLVPSHQALADRLASVWLPTENQSLPCLQLCGENADDARSIATVACQQRGVQLYVLGGERLPTNQADLDAFVGLWNRDATLLHAALLLDLYDLESSDADRMRAVTWLVDQISSPLAISTRERRTLRQLTLTFDIYKPHSSEQRTIWRTTLGQHAELLNGQIDTLVDQFNLGMGAIRTASDEVRRRIALEEATPTNLPTMIWDICRIQARSRLDDLAQRIESTATWDDLVLPTSQHQVLHAIAAHVRQRTRVYEQWGFATKGSRGLGMSALFAGASGTGKTTAAEVLAGELHLDLYKIDLSAVVSKYIGETEKNLRRIFDAAEMGGAILLFDEADALFGKRSEVKDSHDRYANIEVSYLLQRMESYRGLAILTSNMKSALDQAFLRRIRFVVQFPFPDAEQRAEIWRRIFPVATPTEGLEIEKLARLNTPGGNIRNIALNAAFLAADEGSPVRMRHLLNAARVEYAKQEKTLTEAEVAGWN